MKNTDKSKEQLIKEVDQLKVRISELEKSETVYKKAEKAFHKSEQELNAIINGASDGIAFLDRTGKILRINKYIVEIGGFTEEEIVGKRFSVLKMFPLKSMSIMISAFSKLLKGQDISYEVEVYTKKGEKKIVQIHNSLLKKEEKVKGIIAILSDITDRKQAEKEIEAKSELLENLILQSPLPTFVLDDKGICLVVNEAFLKFYAVPDKDMILGSNALTEPKNIKYGVDEYIKEALKGNEIDIPYIEFISPYDSKKVFVKVKMFPIFASEGNLTNVVVIQEDITDHRQAEEALKLSNENFQQVVSNITTIVWKANIGKNGAFENTYTSPVVDELLDLPAGTIKNDWNKFFSYIKPEYLEQVNNTFREAIKSPGKEIDCEYEVLKDNGQTARFYSNGRCFEKNGKLHVFGSTIDITGRKKAEEEIKILAHTIGSINELVSMTDLHNKIFYVNDAFLKAYGYKEDEVLGKPIEMFRSDKTPQNVQNKILPETLAKGWHGEVWNKRKDGSEFHISLSTSVIRDENSQIIALAGIARDITERKRMESELQDRMNELEAFYRATLGREGRVIELKQEVNKLLVQLGKNKKYESTANN